MAKSNALLKRLLTVYKGEDIRYPQLRAVTLAQWMLESGRATSALAKEHYNFGGIKWRPEMAAYATKIKYEANDGVDYYCKFATIESFINGYWAFLSGRPIRVGKSTSRPVKSSSASSVRPTRRPRATPARC